MAEVQLSAIHDAEMRAEKIVNDANEKADQIHKSSNEEIAKIQRAAENSVTRAVAAAHEDKIAHPAPEPIIVPADPAKIKAAKTLIMDEFKRRFSK